LFVAATVKREANTSTSTSLSPSHDLLERNRAIDLMPAGHPNEEKQLQQAVARAYVISKQKKMSLSSFHESVITGSNNTTEAISPRTLNYTSAEQNQLTNGTEITNKAVEEKAIDEKQQDNSSEKVKTKTTKNMMEEDTPIGGPQSKKQKRTRTKWYNITTTMESDLDSIHDHLREHHPNLITRETIKNRVQNEVPTKIFVYQCTITKDTRGTCLVRIMVSTNNTSDASLKISIDPTCNCKDSRHIWNGLNRNTYN
jgi:hypothetical protein